MFARYLVDLRLNGCPGSCLFLVVSGASTVYRIFTSAKPDICAAKKACKFKAELPNDLWQSDVMHGPKVDVNGNMRKSYLIMESTDQAHHSKLTTDIQSRTYPQTASERLCRLVFII